MLSGVERALAQYSRLLLLAAPVHGDRLVVPVDKEKAFRAALNAIGYGMPQV